MEKRFRALRDSRSLCRDLATAIALFPLIGSTAVAAEFNVDSGEDLVDAAPGDGVCAAANGACTLRAAIQEANALPGADRVVLGPHTYLLTIAGSGDAAGDLDVSGDLEIAGVAGTRIVADASLERVFEISAGTIVLRDLEIIQPTASGVSCILSNGRMSALRVQCKASPALFANGFESE